MSPARILETARQAGMDLVALTDHNCGANLPAFAELLSGSEVAGLYGLEVNTLEEAHVICLFDRLEPAMKLGEEVYRSLPARRHCHERFGDQVAVDRDDNITAWADRFLGMASAFPIDKLCSAVHREGGLCIPAHIDRPAGSVISQLGFLPPESDYDAVEVALAAPGEVMDLPYPAIFSSDAHTLEDIGRRYTDINAAGPLIADLLQALRNGEVRTAVRKPLFPG